MKPVVNTEWVQWLSYGKDKNGKAKLKENSPNELKAQYRQHLKEEKKYKNKWIESMK